MLRQRTKIGFVFQNFDHFPHLTVVENIIEAPVSALRRPRKEAVEAAENSVAGSASPTRRPPTRPSSPAVSSSASPSPVPWR
ncbi:Polar amino acid transport system ATP-binding protein OS=Streptomyces violarus OX=67380 GN=FHS41_005398 PE=4 SV=1 [Streptomyces violarus]